MAGVWSGGGNSPPREGSTREQPPPPSHPPPHPEITSNRYAGAGQYPNANPNTHPGYYQQNPPVRYRPSQPIPVPVPHDNHHGHRARLWGPPLSNWPTAARNPFGQALHYHHDQVRLWGPPLSNWPTAARNPFGPAPMPTPCVEPQKPKTITGGVSLKKESLRVEKDGDNPGKHLVAFSFDATAAGSITIFFFATEVLNFQLLALKESMLPAITFQFEAGVGQKYKQASGSGIDFSMFEESELVKEGVTGSYPLVVKMETHPPQETDSNGNTVTQSTYSQINQALFEKENDVYHVKVVKQFMWMNEQRYELLDIYGAENSEKGETDANYSRGNCVICLSEARNTVVLPCRHMCMCMRCANVLISETRPCPICRQLVNQLFEIEV